MLSPLRKFCAAGVPERKQTDNGLSQEHGLSHGLYRARHPVPRSEAATGPRGDRPVGPTGVRLAGRPNRLAGQQRLHGPRGSQTSQSRSGNPANGLYTHTLLQIHKEGDFSTHFFSYPSQTPFGKTPREQHQQPGSSKTRDGAPSYLTVRHGPTRHHQPVLHVLVTEIWEGHWTRTVARLV
jgi:hypothetical protein